MRRLETNCGGARNENYSRPRPQCQLKIQSKPFVPTNKPASEPKEVVRSPLVDISNLPQVAGQSIFSEHMFEPNFDFLKPTKYV